MIAEGPGGLTFRSRRPSLLPPPGEQVHVDIRDSGQTVSYARSRQYRERRAVLRDMHALPVVSWEGGIAHRIGDNRFRRPAHRTAHAI